MTLVSGRGSFLQESILYFNYGASFPVFLTMLRDATKLSTIPPIDLDENIVAKRHTSSSKAAVSSQPSSKHLGRILQEQGNDLEIKHSCKESYWSASGLYVKSSQDDHSSQGEPRFQLQPRGSYARGYTLENGPWLYRFCCEPPRAVGAVYKEIKDNESYLKMTDDLKRVSRDGSSSKYTVLMIHVRFRRPPRFRSRLTQPDYGQKGPHAMEGERATK
jgi:hypothetical protein